MRKKPLSVVFVASEAAPFAKTGGLADVAGALPQALADRGHDVRLFVPLYGAVDRRAYKIPKRGVGVSVPVSARVEDGEILPVKHGGVTVNFIKHEGYFGRSALYNTPDGDYPDNAERFAFFCQATLLALKQSGLKADIIHVNDWQSALIPVYMKTMYKDDPFFRRTASLLTIHNLAFQGRFPPHQWHLLGLDWKFFNVDALEFYGQINFLKGGALFADTISTVSCSYAEEMQTAEQGWGLDTVLKGRAEHLFGIVNGIDTGVWNPAKDPLIPANYTARARGGKKVCKQALLKEMGLASGDQPVLSVISRLVDQKGLGLLMDSVAGLMEHDLKMVFLGSGAKHYETALRDLAMRYPGKVTARIGFDEALAHRIIAGSDIFVIPSLYEPCGLTQMYSLAYGTVPLARATGGLKDTVMPFDPARRKGNGFVFGEYTPGALRAKVAEALDIYNGSGSVWSKIIMNGMREDHSWAKSARQYERLYKKAMKLRRRRA